MAAFKFLLFFTLLLLIALFTSAVVLWMQWPWWVAFFFLLGYAGLYLGWLFIRKILLRRREQQFIHQVVEQDKGSLRETESSGDAVYELQKQWQDALETLKSSHLAKQGNPLYVLPWYMIIGESRSGKSTAIRSAGLTSPFAEATAVRGIGGTRNCDWWFLEQAVILDTAGRYTIPLDEGRDKEEWQKFLSLLVKYRKKEPLNGLVVTMAADKLMQADQETILADGRNIRQRIDELMRVLGKVFPVYVLVTKCDLIQGMNRFCDQLSEEQLRQAMGGVNQQGGNVVEFLHNLGQRTGERLQQLRLRLLGDKADHAADLLLFPNEFKQLHNRLIGFVEAVFKENPYQETPTLRGLYFSSGRQEGTPYSHFLHALGLIREQEVLPGTSRGLFLYDFFARILPGDRHLFAPTQRALAWTRQTGNIGLAAWTTVVLALCGLLSFSFVQNLTTLRSGAEAFRASAVVQGERDTDMAALEHFQAAVSEIEQLNRSWWFPRFGLYASDRAELALKEKFCRSFQEKYIDRFHGQFARLVAEIGSTGQDMDTGMLILHLARRINLIQARLNHEELEGLALLNQPSFLPVLDREDKRAAAERNDRLLLQYHHYLAWQADQETLVLEREQLQRNLTRIFAQPAVGLNWMVSWVNSSSGLEGFDLQDFWPAPLHRKNIATVPPAYTVKGKAVIDGLLTDVETALPDSLLITTNKSRFQAWYFQGYEQVWLDFADAFPHAESYLADNMSWQQVAAVMASDKSPYFTLLRTMAEELTPLEQRKSSWVELVGLIERARKNALLERKVEQEKSLVAKVTKKGKKVVEALDKKTGLNTRQLEAWLLAAGKQWNSYRDSLQEIALATASRAVAYSMTAEVFKDDPAVSPSPFYQARQHLVALRGELTQPDLTSAGEEKTVWRLLTSPFTFLRDYAYLEASCHLNDLWEENVLVELQGIHDKTRLNDELFADNGYALRFIQGPAGPFLSRSLQQGFYPKTALEQQLPFRESFLTFLTKGMQLSRFKPDLSIDTDIPLDLHLEADTVFSPPPAQQEQRDLIPSPPTLLPSYTVTVNANPTSVNPEAKIRPHATTLELICGAKTTRLVNLNYPRREEFVWEPNHCEALTLQVEAGSLVLKKKYEGQLAFAHFADDFRTGSHLFSVAADFPDLKKQLGRMQIKYIKISFRLQGAQPLLTLLDQIEKREKALAAQEEKQKARQAAGSGQEIKEALAAWERKQKMRALENEAMKQAWKARQEAKARRLKKAWEDKLPDIPLDITTCWDN
ncbi:MAG: type VI secretion protein IcmF/TssM N-terminal domain-containing protein [Candidatus Electrothrix sp. GW3-4]|uniref:type VI secretion protein IcmF/TssM N-terminal domain-containing protein n=1 Tax=Candidatus Electrothrix sp. GW3-4 TaxID=3126740 RepID=UPI0030CE480F